jgi:polyphosphate glucokinase
MTTADSTNPSPTNGEPVTPARRGFGVDVGGSGIKGGIVDLDTGELVGDRYKLPTPQPATPSAVATTIADVVNEFGWTGPLGVTYPGVVTQGIVRTAANVDKKWIGTNARDSISAALNGQEVVVLNDADAAGLAEVRYGAAKGRAGLVIVTTLGTGIGSAMVYNGVLVPNSELGHLEIDGHDAESRAANSARERDELSFKHWAKRLTKYYRTLEMLFSPDLFVVGGGISKESEEFLPMVDIDTEIIPAKLLNRAGVVGAALYASENATS